MRTQFKLIDKRLSGSRDVLDSIFGAFGEMKKDVYRGVVDVVVSKSPVDTGTYMDSHDVYDGRSRAATDNSSKGKPRNRPREAHAGAALDRMYAQIDALDPSADKVYIGNRSHHGMVVEYGGPKTPAYAPYTQGRAAVGRIIQFVLMGYKKL